ncbi:porin [Ferrimonas pelagia]|uniref:Porin n=1 Tax=Ferrimonas pelagia TaxID=1177826 RepID=A0ABP9FBL8_9GAMM
MKKTLLAAAIPALLAANVSAVELYDDGKNSFAIGGHMTIQANASDGDVNVAGNSPRMNFSWNSDLGNGYKLDSRIEYGFSDVVGDADNVLFHRLGYIGVSHEDFGRVSIGKQWSAYFVASQATDQPIYISSDALHTYGGAAGSHGDLGLGRANSAIQYTNNFDVAGGNFSFVAQHQGAQGNFDDRYSIGMAYKHGDLRVAYAYSGGDVTFDATVSPAMVTDNTVDVNTQVVSANYGSYGDGLSLAAAYSWAENLQGLGIDSFGYEAVAAYGTGTFTYAVKHQYLENDTELFGKNGAAFNHTFATVEWNVASNFVPFVGYTVEHDLDVLDANGNVAKNDNNFAIGARVYF